MRAHLKRKLHCTEGGRVILEPTPLCAEAITANQRRATVLTEKDKQ